MASDIKFVTLMTFHVFFVINFVLFLNAIFLSVHCHEETLLMSVIPSGTH